MPITYTSAKNIKPAQQALEIHCVGINIRVPREGEGDSTVTYYFEALDASGNLVSEAPVTVPVSQVAAEKPADFATVNGILKTDAYERARTLYPTGGSIT